jgi:hypothetical protein
MGTGLFLGVKRTSEVAILTDRSNFLLAVLCELVLRPKHR